MGIDNYNNFLSTLSNHNIKDYVKTYTIAHSKLTDKSFETFVAFLDVHITDIIKDAASTNPFVGAAEAQYQKKIDSLEKRFAAQEKTNEQTACCYPFFPCLFFYLTTTSVLLY